MILNIDSNAETYVVIYTGDADRMFDINIKVDKIELDPNVYSMNN